MISIKKVFVLREALAPDERSEPSGRGASWDWAERNPRIDRAKAEKVLKAHGTTWDDFVGDNPDQASGVDSETLIGWLGY